MHFAIVQHFDIGIGGLFAIAATFSCIGGFAYSKLQGKTNIEAAVNTPFSDVPLDLADKITDLFDVMDAVILRHADGLIENQPYQVIREWTKTVGHGVDVAKAIKMSQDWSKLYDWNQHQEKVKNALVPADAVERANQIMAGLKAKAEIDKKAEPSA